MDGMSPYSTDQWIQDYPYPPMAQSGGEPSPPDSSHGTTSQQAGPKPIRKRSRASRRTPVTILNASPTDFRALVQRFTGCDSKDNAASASVASLPKGPVTIDFARNESSSRYTYFDNQVRSNVQGEQVPAIGGWNPLQSGYGVENGSIIYESVDESSSLMATQRDGGFNHGFHG
ncbi:hypothetical protein SSX86_003269 [Deinandra increscens subsp. villosa]|uniref:VQ domain-containing protein n=1 Tax=Deinandra increscens subsp. villosa TaxID=3103831 RepID=A0AAP0DGX7_9ASTR